MVSRNNLLNTFNHKTAVISNQYFVEQNEKMTAITKSILL